MDRKIGSEPGREIHRRRRKKGCKKKDSGMSCDRRGLLKDGGLTGIRYRKAGLAMGIAICVLMSLGATGKEEVRGVIESRLWAVIRDAEEHGNIEETEKEENGRKEKGKGEKKNGTEVKGEGEKENENGTGVKGKGEKENGTGVKEKGEKENGTGVKEKGEQKNGMGVKEKDAKEKEGHKDKRNGEGEDEDDGEGKDEEEVFTVEVSPPDGKEGYYRSHPGIRITEKRQDKVMKYRLEREGGEISEGEIEGTDFPDIEWREGRQILTIWQEKEETENLPQEEQAEEGEKERETEDGEKGEKEEDREREKEKGKEVEEGGRPKKEKGEEQEGESEIEDRQEGEKKEDREGKNEKANEIEEGNRQKEEKGKEQEDRRKREGRQKEEQMAEGEKERETRRKDEQVETVEKEEDHPQKEERIKYEWSREIFIDTIPPAIRLLPQPGLYGWVREPFTFKAYSVDVGSGMRETLCFENGGEIGRGTEEVSGTVSKEAVDGSPTEILVRAEDRAGNACEKRLEAYIDKKPPSIVVEGGEDYMITSRAVDLQCRVMEENHLKDVSGTLEREETKGETEKTEVGTWKKDKKEASVNIGVEKDGKYRLKLWAEDMSGRQAQKEMRFILDSQNPIIRYVDQLQGKYLRKFVWEYTSEETIEDMTSVQYGMGLDGRIYAAGEEVTEEGKHHLEVKAKDAAGNMAKAQAEFVIDHTPPTIVWEGVKEGGMYAKEVTLKVRTEKAEDTVKRIWVNGRLQKDVEKEGMLLKDTGDYKVTAEAEDLAGNTCVKSCSFQLVSKAGWIRQTLESLKNMKNKGLGNGSYTDGGEGGSGRWKKVTLVSGACTALWGIWGLHLYRKHFDKKKKISHKREEAR